MATAEAAPKAAREASAAEAPHVASSTKGRDPLYEVMVEMLGPHRGVRLPDGKFDASRGGFPKGTKLRRSELPPTLAGDGKDLVPYDVEYGLSRGAIREVIAVSMPYGEDFLPASREEFDPCPVRPRPSPVQHSKES